MSAMQDGFLDKNGISALSLPESIHGYCISGAFSNLHGSTASTASTPDVEPPSTKYSLALQQRLANAHQAARRPLAKAAERQ